MATFGLAWLTLHSPLRPEIDRWLGVDGPCTALCRGWREVAERVAMAWLIGWSCVAAVLAAARLGLRPNEQRLAWIVVAYALATVPAALLGGLGDIIGRPLLRPPMGPMLASLPALVIAAWAWTRPARPPAAWPAMPRWSPVTWWMVGVAALALVVSGGIAASLPPIGFDELNYHAPMAVLLWRDGSLVSFLEASPGRIWLSHPGTSELWLGSLRMLGGEAMFVLGQLPFAILGALAVSAIGRRLGVPGRLVAVGGATWLLVPIVLIQIGRVSDDVIAASLGLAVAAWLAAPAREWSSGRVLLVLVGLGLMAATKLAMLPAVAALGALALAWSVQAMRQRPDARHAILAGWAVGVAVAILVVAPWVVRGMLLYGNPLHPAAAGPLAGVAQTSLTPLDGRFVPSAAWWPLYPLLATDDNSSGLGLAWVVGALPGLVIALRVAASRRPLWLLGVSALVVLPAWWLLTRHEPRHLLLLTGLLATVVPFVVAGVALRWRTPVALMLGAAAALSAAVTLSSVLAGTVRLPSDRTRLYVSMARTEAALLELPQVHDVLLDDQCLPMLDLPYPILGPTQDRHIATIGCAASTDDVLATAERYGLDHVYAVIRRDEHTLLDARYPGDRFELLHRSADTTVLGVPLERRLYRIIEEPSAPGG